MEGLSIKFIEEIKNTIEIIKKYPDAFTDFTKHTKKATLIKFPYNIIYSIINDTIYIIAIAHQHRKPNYWIERMK